MNKKKILAEGIFITCAAPIFLAAAVFVAVFVVIFIPLAIALLLLGVVLDHCLGLDYFTMQTDNDH
jgi:hypothetical protein